MRGGVLLVLVVLVAAVGAASAHADAGGTTTAGTTTTAAPSYAPLAGSRLTARCVGAGAAAISVPGRRVLAFGTPASSLPASAYPTDAPVIAFGASSETGSTCHSAHVALSSVSLFGGAVTASSVEATHGTGSVTGLEVDGEPVDPVGGAVTYVGDWGQLTLGVEVGRVTAPLVLLLLKRHDSLPAGTTVAVAFGAVGAPRAAVVSAPSHPATSQAGKRQQHASGKEKHRRKKRVPQPLKWTPRLGLNRKHYVFPVDGGASYVDTYGANRNDIYDGWHHGDDLFAPIGTPVVAVARGKLSLVGWNKLGGWRLWLTDNAGNSFYYAHLAGYARWILHHRNVKAGQVIGFLGRTGDAFTTTPHLHFEVHPHQLLQLNYDGAVDPTSYLEKWTVERVAKKNIPQPARLVAPRGTPAQEAAVVWHELLVARHLVPSRPAVSATAVRRPFPEPSAAGAPGPWRRVTAARLAAHTTPAGGAPWPLVTAALAAFAIGLGLFAVRRSLHRRGQA